MVFKLDVWNVFFNLLNADFYVHTDVYNQQQPNRNITVKKIKKIVRFDCIVLRIVFIVKQLK